MQTASTSLKRALPASISSLVHHVALNESGWWDKNIRKIILSAFWTSENYTITNERVKSLLRESFGVTVSARGIERHLHELTTENAIIRISPVAYKLSESGIERIIIEIKEHLEAEKLAADSFKALFREHCPDLSGEEQWLRFNEEFLHALVRELGARTYELILNNADRVVEHPAVQSYIGRYSAKNRENIKKVILAFFAPKQLAARRYILRKITTYYCLEAEALSPETIRLICPAGAQPVTWKLYLDSNVLFAFLGLHDAKSNETVQTLLSLIHDVREYIRIQFYVTPATLAETSKVLKRNIELLKNIRAEQHLASPPAMLEYNGIAQKYFSDNGRSFGVVSVDEYFSPYVHNLSAIIRSKGIEIYLANIEEYKTDKNVADDITTAQSIAGSGADKEKIEHDVMLWHFIKDIRPGMIESPVYASDWIMTDDAGALEFDVKKRGAIGYGDIPVCIHPSSLLEALQLWVPRSETFERAVSNSRRLPFLMRGFDAESETVTVKILQTMLRFEQIENLTGDVMASILVNTVLTNKLSAPADLRRQSANQSSVAATPAHRSERGQNETLNDRLRSIEQLFREIKTSLQEEPGFRQGNISKLYS